ncbi:MAG TPA: hypothetical protein VHY37_10195 [Tepidisphaeraceae bacterium]|nr:hypothetical protein [Tepidisphaeraceae bacterium]
MVLLLVAASWAAPDTQPDLSRTGGDKGEPLTVVRVYDVRDYLTVTGNYPLDPARQSPMNLPTGSWHPPKLTLNAPQNPTTQTDKAPPAAASVRIDDLLKLIESVVAPDSWRDNGGSVGGISELDGKLYVMQTPVAQAQVKVLLANVTGDAKRTLQITASWLLLSDDELAALREPAKAGEDAAIILLDDAALQKELPMARARLLCLDGQTVHITAAAGRMKLKVNPILSARKGQVILDVLNEVGGRAGRRLGRRAMLNSRKFSGFTPRRGFRLLRISSSAESRRKRPRAASRDESFIWWFGSMPIEGMPARYRLPNTGRRDQAGRVAMASAGVHH